MERGSGMATKAQNAGVTFPWVVQVSYAAKTGHRVTTSEGVEHRQGHRLVRTKSFGDLVSRDEPETLSNSKGNPQLRDIEAIG